MGRWLVLLLALAVVLGFFLLRPPGGPREEAGVRLQGVAFALFPEEEGVEWRFLAEEMVEEGGVFRIRGGISGARYVEGRLDLRLFAPEVVVEPGDNLRLPTPGWRSSRVATAWSFPPRVRGRCSFGRRRGSRRPGCG